MFFFLEIGFHRVFEVWARPVSESHKTIFDLINYMGVNICKGFHFIFIIKNGIIREGTPSKFYDLMILTRNVFMQSPLTRINKKSEL